MLEHMSVEEVGRYVGHEMIDVNGEKVGYVDVVFTDIDSGTPEWIGVWNGLPGARRYLVPLRGVAVEPDVDGDPLRLPWTKDRVETAPTYDEEDSRGLIAEDPEGFAISPEKEREAYAHYGVEPAVATGPGGTRAVRLRAVMIAARRA
jgi:hypothetical protein